MFPPHARLGSPSISYVVLCIACSNLLCVALNVQFLFVFVVLFLSDFMLYADYNECVPAALLKKGLKHLSAINPPSPSLRTGHGAVS